jgi:2-dehydro-3-deoxyphosphogluconate aldolase/(4S)-4-hydroxy-2-oxoglutarate aldolase
MAESPGLMLGAGTVLTEDQAKKVVRAGVRFFVSPGFAKVVDWCLAAEVRAIMPQMREKQ